MIVDSSALLARLFNEAAAERCARSMNYADELRMSSANYFEAAIVVDRRGNAVARRLFDELIREIELLAPAQVTLLADRRKFPPYGLDGGEAGKPGQASVTPKGNASVGATPEPLPGKCSRQLHAGDTLRLETPGGGGWGKP